MAERTDGAKVSAVPAPARGGKSSGKAGAAGRVEVAPRQNGRPTIYNPETAEIICDRLAAGEPLDQICAEPGMPGAATVRRWVMADREGFAAHYARARELQAHAMADQVLSISDDARNDWMERHGQDDTGWQANGEHIQRSRLRVDSRKWLMGKMLPKTYGDKTMLTGPDGETAPKFVMMGVVEEASPEAWEAKQRAQIEADRQESLGVHGPKPKETSS